MTAATKTLILAVLVALAGGARAASASPLEVKAGPAAGRASELLVTGRIVTAGASRLVPRRPQGPSPASDNLGAFLTHDVEDARVVVTVDGRRAETRSGDEGFFRVTLGADEPLKPGTFVATIEAKKGHAEGHHRVYVQVIPDGRGLTLVSDFDDSIVVTGVRDLGTLVKNGFLTAPEDLKPVPRMSALYRCFAESGTGPRVVQYVTATPVNLQQRVMRYLAYQHFPRGPVVLKHVDLGHLGNLQGFKVSRILHIAHRFPGHRFVLIGDDGQLDPEVYKAVRLVLGHRVAAILIREVPGVKVKPHRLDGMIPFHDGRDAATALARLGLVDAGCARAVSAARR